MKWNTVLIRFGWMWPLETDLLVTLAEAGARPGTTGIHGFELAHRITPDPPGEVTRGVTLQGGRWLIESGRVYKALHRLERVGAVSSSWEDPTTALAAKRPRRRYYTLTENGIARARMAPGVVRARQRRQRLYDEIQAERRGG